MTKKTSLILLPILINASLFGAPRESSATPRLNSTEGHVNFYKHTGTSDDAYTSGPSPATVQFMNQHFTRLLTFSPYWDTLLTYDANAWFYSDSYAIYLNDPQLSQKLQQHPDWFLHDANGNKLYINFGCGGGTCPQYAANITDPNGFRASWIAAAASALNRSPSYKGIWIDDVNLDLSGHVSDGNGQPVTPIDPLTGNPMTNAAWRMYFADFMEQVRAAFPNVEIVHNSLYFANGCDPTDPQIQREIRAADFLNLERGVNDSGITGGNGCFSFNSILAFIDNVHGNGRGVVFDAENADSTAQQEYSLASYLLISTGKDLVGDDQETPTHWWTGFETDLGAAQTGRATWNNLLRRDFTGGIVLVNPPGGATTTVTLPTAYQRLDGTTTTSVTLAATQGAVLKTLPPLTPTTIATVGSPAPPFFGPLPSWLNVKTAGAAGNGSTDDTAAIQNALNTVGIGAQTGIPYVIYFPAGIYRLTGTLRLQDQNISFMGEDPATTTLKWAGPAGGDMLLANGVAHSQFGRITWDGQTSAGSGIHFLWDGLQGYYDSGDIDIFDSVFENMGKGIIGGSVPPGNGDSDMGIHRCVFRGCSRGRHQHRIAKRGRLLGMGFAISEQCARRHE